MKRAFAISLLRSAAAVSFLSAPLGACTSIAVESSDQAITGTGGDICYQTCSWSGVAGGDGPAYQQASSTMPSPGGTIQITTYTMTNCAWGTPLAIPSYPGSSSDPGQCGPAPAADPQPVVATVKAYASDGSLVSVEGPSSDDEIRQALAQACAQQQDADDQPIAFVCPGGSTSAPSDAGTCDCSDPVELDSPACSSACALAPPPVAPAPPPVMVAPGACAATITEPAAANALLANCAPNPVVPSDNSCGFTYSYNTGRLTGWTVDAPPYGNGNPEPLPPGGIGSSYTLDCFAVCSQQAYNNDGKLTGQGQPVNAPVYTLPTVNGDANAYCKAVAADPGSQQAIKTQLTALGASRTALLDTGVKVTLTVKNAYQPASGLPGLFDPADIAAACGANATAAAQKLCAGQTVQVTSCVSVQGGACNTGFVPVQNNLWN